MLHYHVWFSLRPNVAEADGVLAISKYLDGLCQGQEALEYTLLRNKGNPPRSKLLRYHALVQFTDAGQLAEAMKNQADRGIHSGGHGAVLEVVSDFHVEIFEELATNKPTDIIGAYACEI
jgi:hypothetical protein